MQSVHESKSKGHTGKTIINSPYGVDRNATYGWSSVFGTPSAFSARVSTGNVHQRIYIGTSSLNAVPDGYGCRGGKDRSFTTLLSIYAKKFGALEHCYPSHRLGSVEEWREWKKAAAIMATRVKGGGRDSSSSDISHGVRSCYENCTHAQKSIETLSSGRDEDCRGESGQNRNGDNERASEAVERVKGESTPPSLLVTSAVASSFCLSNKVVFINGVPPPEGIPILRIDPSRFIYTIKANKYLTHELQLQCHTEEALRHVNFFFNELCRELDPYLGPVLIQLPPSFERTAENVARLRRFHEILPKDEIILVYPQHNNVSTSFCEACSTLPPPSSSSSSSASLSTSIFYSWERRRRIRIAVEFRHTSWYHREIFDLFREFQWAIVVTDYLGIGSSSWGVNGGQPPCKGSPSSYPHQQGGGGRPFLIPIDTGVSFMYCRFHGAVEKYAGDYGPILLQRWVDRYAEFLSGEGREWESKRKAKCQRDQEEKEVDDLEESRLEGSSACHSTDGALSFSSSPFSSSSSPVSSEKNGKEVHPFLHLSSSFSTITSAAHLYKVPLSCHISTAATTTTTTCSSSSSASAPYREVFCFFNNNDSHVQRVASSVVDASCLAKLLRDRWSDSIPTSTLPLFSSLFPSSETCTRTSAMEGRISGSVLSSPSATRKVEGSREEDNADISTLPPCATSPNEPSSPGVAAKNGSLDEVFLSVSPPTYSITPVFSSIIEDTACKRKRARCSSSSSSVSLCSHRSPLGVEITNSFSSGTPARPSLSVDSCEDEEDDDGDTSIIFISD